MSKTVTTVIVLAAAAAGGVWLYRRGKAQQDAAQVQGSVAATLKSGIGSLIAQVKSAVPKTPTLPTAEASTPTAASSDPRDSQRIATDARWNPITTLKSAQAPMRQRDWIAQGIAK